MNDADRRIFVQIASYRDRECQWTVRDLFNKARHPERVFVGVCWQRVPEEDADCFQVRYPRPKQVRVADFQARDARGLGWARKMAQGLWRGEEYTLQIDSHMRFARDWDTRMLAMADVCGSQRPVLTLYPAAYTPPDNRVEPEGPFVQCVGEFLNMGILAYSAKPVPKGLVVDRPQPTAGCAGGFIFGPASIIEEVPSDPEIYFTGEEPNLAVRLWTHGYDLFSPHETLIYHYYGRGDSLRHWDDFNWTDRHKITLKRMRQLLEPETLLPEEQIDLGDYGFGRVRSLAEYETFAGVNFAGRTIASFARSFPFVMTDRTLEELDPGAEIVPSEHAHLFVLEDEGLLFTEDRSEVYRLNPAATYLWCLLEEGCGRAELEQALVDTGQVSPAEARRRLARIIAHWRGQWVLAGSEQAEPPRERSEPQGGALKLVPQMDVSRLWILARAYRLLDTTLTVRYTEAEQEAWVHRLLAHLEVPLPAEPENVLTLRRMNKYYFLYIEQRAYEAGADIRALGFHVLSRFMRLAIDAHAHVLNLHAGVVARGNACIALPAVTGNGKTALTAALVAAGFDYLSDEVALLERETCRVRSVPLPFCVRESGVELIAPLFPDVCSLPVQERADGVEVRYLAPPVDRMADPATARPLTHLVFPRLIPGARTRLTPMRTLDGFGRALEECVSIPGPLSLEDAAVLVDWIEGVSCYDLVMGPLGEAVGLVQGLASEHT